MGQLIGIFHSGVYLEHQEFPFILRNTFCRILLGINWTRQLIYRPCVPLYPNLNSFTHFLLSFSALSSYIQTMASSTTSPKTAKKHEGKGKSKIEIKKVEQASKRLVTFSKRKLGLFLKASELSLLCDSHIANVTLI